MEEALINGRNPVKDSQLTAFSSYYNYGTDRSRLHTQQEGNLMGSWCAASNNDAQWIQVITQVNLFKKGLGVGVPGNQHEKNTYAQGKIKDSKANSGVDIQGGWDFSS